MSRPALEQHEHESHERSGHESKVRGRALDTCAIDVDEDNFGDSSYSVVIDEPITFKLNDGRTADALITIVPQEEGSPPLFTCTDPILVTSTSPVERTVSNDAHGYQYTISTSTQSGIIGDPMQGTIRVGSGSGEDH